MVVEVRLKLLLLRQRLLRRHRLLRRLLLLRWLLLLNQLLLLSRHQLPRQMKVPWGIRTTQHFLGASVPDMESIPCQQLESLRCASLSKH